MATPDSPNPQTTMTTPDAPNTNTSPPPSRPSIGLIVCSTRQPRVGPQIASFVLDTIKASELSHSADLHTIDLSTWNLPLFNEPTVPAQTPPSAPHTGYAQPHTIAWSLEIQKHPAFIFVTPQYNWGYPASIKNAIDYLYHEWKGKPAMIVSYGGHGGGKAAGQLRQVLEGVRMTVVENMPGLQFLSRGVLEEAGKGGDLGLGSGREDRMWKMEEGKIGAAFGELMGLLV